jgi:hypothetical protein
MRIINNLRKGRLSGRRVSVSTRRAQLAGFDILAIVRLGSNGSSSGVGGGRSGRGGAQRDGDAKLRHHF